MLVVVTFLTIGHSNHSIEDLVGLLRDNDVQVVVDVRSSPYSSRHPQFDLPDLRDAVGDADMQYIHMPELGGRPRGREYYDSDGRVSYARLAGSAAFRSGIDRLLDGATRFRICLLCSEEDPTGCHRWRLIARRLADADATVLHIRGDGELESDQHVRLRDERLHPDLYQLSLIEPPEDPWRSTKPVNRSR